MKPFFLSLFLIVAASAAEPSYSVHRTSASHSHLLAGNERSWKPAEQISWGPERFRTNFRALWHDGGLYLRF